MARRVALTQKQAASRVGTKLIEALSKILEDGKITPKEVELLKDWLERARQQDDFEALRFLSEEVESILADGEISIQETLYLAEAAIRVLPAELRAEAKAKLNRTVADMPTDKQVSFIKDLGGVLPQDTTKQDASELIQKLLDQRPTIRQRMVLKFWGRDDLANAGVDGVSRWMDNFYGEDRDRAVAWELWKRQTPGSDSRDPNLLEAIPYGAGESYLAQVKQAKDQRTPKQAFDFWVRVAFYLSVLVLVVVAVWAIVSRS